MWFALVKHIDYLKFVSPGHNQFSFHFIHVCIIHSSLSYTLQTVTSFASTLYMKKKKKSSVATVWEILLKRREYSWYISLELCSLCLLRWNHWLLFAFFFMTFCISLTQTAEYWEAVVDKGSNLICWVSLTHRAAGVVNFCHSVKANYHLSRSPQLTSAVYDSVMWQIQDPPPFITSNHSYDQSRSAPSLVFSRPTTTTIIVTLGLMGLVLV